MQKLLESVEIHISENQIIDLFDGIVKLVTFVTAVQFSVYVWCQYIFNTVLDSFPFTVKNSHIKLNSVSEAYLKIIVFVSVVTMKQEIGGSWPRGRKWNETGEKYSESLLFSVPERQGFKLLRNTAFSFNDTTLSLKRDYPKES